MKTFAIVFAICLIGAVTALNDAQKAKLKEHKEMLASLRPALKLVDNAKKGNVDVTDQKLACFSACLLQKIGIMNPDGSFNEDVTRSKIPAHVEESAAVKVINKCKSFSGANDCETGRMLYKCYLENKTVEHRMILGWK